MKRKKELLSGKILSPQASAEILSDLVNGRMRNFMEISKCLQNEHRYLQNEVFLLLCNIIDQNAKAFEEGRYDGRNEFACKLSNALKKTKDNFRL